MSSLKTALGVAVLLLVMPMSASGHVVKDAPWHPLAKAYLFAIFVSDLKPADWAGIGRRYSSSDYPDQGGKSVYAMMGPISRFAANDQATAIRRAIHNRNRMALRVAATRAMSMAVRHHLAEARGALANRPSLALRQIGLAQEMYRPFARFIREADEDGFRRLGLAWLDLSTLAGKGLGPGGSIPKSNIDAFGRTAKVIESYIAAHYETAPAASIARRGPVPDAGHGRTATWKPAPWLPPDTNINDQNPLPRLVLKFEAKGIDERNLFMVAYGDMLFDSPEIFGTPARKLGIACATCHNRSDVNRDLFIPGLSRRAGGIDVDSSHFNRRGNDMQFDPVDTPSLRGIRFTAPYGRDGRTASLREFTRNVIVGEFGGPEPTPLMLDALVAYMNEFDFLPAPHLRADGRLNRRASASARRGQTIFNRPFAQMGGKSCATCHIPSANFMDGRRHNIGTKADGAFDTPTLRNIVYTAPYFHDGRLPSLAAVVQWFDKRFGLALSAVAKRDLTAYLRAVGSGEDPYEKFDAKATPFRLDFEEMSTFLSTLDELIPARDAFHARLLLRTVSRDMQADASAVSDLTVMPKVFELSGLLVSIDKAIGEGDWRRAASIWTRYKTTEKKYANQLY